MDIYCLKLLKQLDFLNDQVMPSFVIFQELKILLYRKEIKGRIYRNILTPIDFKKQIL